MAQAPLPFLLAGSPVASTRVLTVPDRFSGAPAFGVCMADASDFDRAIAAAAGAAGATAAMPLHARASALRALASEINTRADHFTRVLVIEAGKPLRDARAEVSRAAETFSAAADACSDAAGEFLRLDSSPRAPAFRAVSQRVPIGPLGFITPFNFPLNLVAHKVAPAIAAGCPWVLKPSDKAPVSALMLGEAIVQCGLPAGSWSILPATVEHARAIVTDERIKLLSFTGSAAVGWTLKSECGRKKIVLELGGDAACVVDSDADLPFAVSRLVVGMFSNSGQSCISVQRVLAHRAIYAELRSRLTEAVRSVTFGDPSNEQTIVGPLITQADARRVECWISSAVTSGANLLCGGIRDGSMVAPTLLENLPPTCELAREEAFGPVAAIEPFDSFDQAISKVNASRFGLQCGVFTRDIGKALQAWNRMEVGAVVINDVPTFRTEAMPYGGVKDSGLGREGIRSAIAEFTEPRLMVINQTGLL